MRCPDLLTVVLLACLAEVSHAETVVTACGTDNAAGGVNLTTALAAGGDIRIACAGGPNQITFTNARVLPAATTIEGGGVTLIGSGSGVMFELNPGLPQPLILRNLTIRNPPSNPADPNLFAGIVYDPHDIAVVELANVTVTDTRLPFAVRKLVARDSTFAGNGDANNSDFGVVMAGDLELHNVVFRDNLSRPFHALWRGDPIAKKEKISARVIKCTFERNKRPALWAAGDIAIESSSFVDNGDAAPFAPGGRGALYGGTIFLELGQSAGGAFEIVLGRATISRSTFKGNHGMLGGAVLAWSAALTLQSSDFDSNRAVSGGAVAYLSPSDDSPVVSAPGLHLAHVRMRDNEAAKDGGALLVLGDVSGDVVLLSKNKAGQSGGALAVVGAGILPTEAVPAAFGGKLPVPGARPTRVELMRSFVLDNTAATHAVDAGSGAVRFGNSLFSRNVATAAGGAVIDARNMELVNSTVMGNHSEGLRIEAGGTDGARIVNVILAGNAPNCSGALAALKISGPNLQFPDAGCGAMPVADPSLDSRFAPSMFSPARNSGAVAVCAAHDLVEGHDLYAKARGAASCAIGAVESDIVRDVIEKVGPKNVPCLLLLILLFLLICFLVGILIGLRRRRRKKV